MCVLFDVGKLNVTTSPPVDKPKQQQQQVPDRRTLLKLMLCSHLRRTDSPLGLLCCNVILNYWGKGSSIPETAALVR